MIESGPAGRISCINGIRAGCKCIFCLLSCKEIWRWWPWHLWPLSKKGELSWGLRVEGWSNIIIRALFSLGGQLKCAKGGRRGILSTSDWLEKMLENRQSLILPLVFHHLVIHRLSSLTIQADAFTSTDVIFRLHYKQKIGSLICIFCTLWQSTRFISLEILLRGSRAERWEKKKI